MRKIITLILILFIFLAVYFLNPSITGFSAAIDKVSVDEEVLNEISKEGKASIIVVLKEPKPSRITGFTTAIIKTKVNQEKVLATLSKNEFKKEHEYSIIEGFSGEVTAEGLRKLRQNPNVEKIYFDRVYSLSLADSVPLVNASKLHPYQINNQNITGVGETICILDTGVNYSHESLGGCDSLSEDCKVVGGYDYVNDDADPYDDNGHGTHVAGIAAANGNLIGIAPDASIAMIKVCDASGSCSSANILSGLEWCVTNKDIYNISVISMSLGDGGEYTSATCPSDSIDMGIASAFDAGIFLTAAAGNNDYTSGVSHPACNGDVASAGTLKSNDKLKYNRGGDVLTILAPGLDIISTSWAGSTQTMSGTSMSTPFIAGAAAILQQYAKANTGQISQSEIKLTLNSTGKVVYDVDSLGTYARISVYEAVKSLTDVLGPSLSMISPLNMAYDTNVSLSLDYTVNDINDVNSVWYNIDGGDNVTISESTDFNTTEGSKVLTLYANDSLGNENSVSVSFITDVTNPVVSLATQNDSYAKNPVTFTFSLTEQNPDSCDLYGSWDDWHLNQTKSASENSFTSNLEEGLYTWNIECNDTAGNENFADENRTINVDSTLPSVTIDLPQNTDYAIITDLELNFSAVDTNLDSCWYSIDSGDNVTIDDCGNTTFNVSEDSHTITVFVNDSAGNENYAETSFVTDVTSPVVNLESPLNDSFSNPENVQFQFKAIDANLDNCKLYGNWDGWHLNQTKTELVSGSLTSFDQIVLEDGSYIWNVECFDSAGNSAFNNTNYTMNLDATLPILIVSSPENTTYSDNASLALAFSAVDANLDSCWYSLNNGANTMITNCENTTFDTPDEQNNLKVYAKDKANNEVSAEVSFVADIAYPLITLSSPSEGASIESSANFTYLVDDSGIANCSLLINGTINSTDDSVTTSVTQEFTLTLTDDRYYWAVSCVDNANRESVSGERNVIICTENWNCTDWGSCSDSQQTRTCTDLNGCDTIYRKPTESQSCTESTSSGEATSEASETGGAISDYYGPEETEESSPQPLDLDMPVSSPPEEQGSETTESGGMMVTEELEEERGFVGEIIHVFKNWRETLSSPGKIISTTGKFVKEKKSGTITAGSFIFIIFMATFVYFYYFKKQEFWKGKKKGKKKDAMEVPTILMPRKKTASKRVTKLRTKLGKRFSGIFDQYRDLIGGKWPKF